MAYNNDEPNVDTNHESIRTGKDRRKAQRRTSDDRREMIRFEMDKEDRRTNLDRRKDNRSGWDSGTNN
ncbi:MAG: hypothetical protein Kow0083_12570 [Methylophaga sp.]